MKTNKTFYLCISGWRSYIFYVARCSWIKVSIPFKPSWNLITTIPSPKTEPASKIWGTICTRGAFLPFSANPTLWRVRPSCKGSVVKGRVVYLHAGWFVVSGCYGDHWCLVHSGLCPQWAETVNIAATTLHECRQSCVSCLLMKLSALFNYEWEAFIKILTLPFSKPLRSYNEYVCLVYLLPFTR